MRKGRALMGLMTTLLSLQVALATIDTDALANSIGMGQASAPQL